MGMIPNQQVPSILVSNLQFVGICLILLRKYRFALKISIATKTSIRVL